MNHLQMAELKWLSRREARRHDRDERQRVVACTGKQPYANSYDAGRHSQYRRHNRARVYQCTYCDKWHVS